MIRATLSALIAHWRRHKLQALFLIAGLALATGLWTGVQAINAEARAAYAEAEALMGQQSLPRIEGEGGAPIPEARFAELRRAGWQVSPVVEGVLRLPGLRLTVIGIDPLSLPAQAGVSGVVSEGVALGDFLRPPGVLLVDPALLAEVEAALSDRPDRPVLRATDALPARSIITDIGPAQSLLRMPGTLSYLLLAPGGEGRGPLPTGLVRIEPEAVEGLGSLTDSFHLNLTAFGLLAFAVGLFIAHSAIGLAFEQRRGTFRTLRALGVPARTLGALLLLETAVLAIPAGLLGVALGYGVAAALLPGVAATLGGLYGAEVPGSLTLRPGWVAAGLGMALLGAGIAAVQGLFRLWRMPVLDAARPRAWLRATRAGMTVQLVAAMGLAAFALVLGVYGRGLFAGFAMLAAVLLTAALLLPSVLVAGLSLGARLSHGVRAGWLWADLKQAVPSLSLALMALMLALATNVGVGAMVGSFRLTFLGWLDQRLFADIYVTARTEDEAARLRTFLADRPDVAVLPVWSAEGMVGGAPGAVYGVSDDPGYRESWPLIAAAPGVWEAVAAGEGALVNEQVARRGGLWPGQVVTLPGGVSLPVVGVYSDYGNPRAQAMIGLDLFLLLHPDAPRLQHALRTRDPPGLIATLGEVFGLQSERLRDQAAVRDLSLSIFERTFAVTQALNALTLAVAGVALVAALAGTADLRPVQIAPVWALGVPRRWLLWAEAGRLVVLAALVAVVAVGVGLVLAWTLLAVVNVEAFGWRIPLHLFPADWAAMAGLALLIGALAAVLPVLRLHRSPPGQLVRVFAQER